MYVLLGRYGLSSLLCRDWRGCVCAQAADGYGLVRCTGRAGYVLPVKRPVRIAEALDVGDMATVTVELIDFT